MIVTCENCDTRFNLDENLIKESGSKVRCSKCHHIFTAYKPVAVEEPEPSLELEEDLAGLAEEESEFEGLALEEETAPEKTLAEEEISLKELGIEEEATTEQTAAVEEEVFLEEKPGGEEIVSEEVEPEQEIAPEEIPEVEEREAVVEEALVKETVVEEPAVEEEPEEEVAEEALRARKRISTPVMILLALGLLAGGAFGAYTILKSFDVRIPFLETLTGAPEPTTVDPGNLHIALLEHLITSELVENSTADRLVVIRGKVRNDYPEARNFIMVRGVVYSIDGKPIQRKTAYCGNTLSDSDLQTLDKATMDAKLRNKFGDERSNFRVPSGKVIPFVVVFSDLPEELGEFSVSVVSSVAG